MSAGNIERTASSRASHRPSQVIDDWASSAPFDATEALGRHPEMANERSIVLDWAFEEYCQRIDCGEAVDAGAFVHRFAGIEHSLLGLIQARQFLQENLPVLQGLSEVNWPAVATDFAGYELIEELGRGAFSRVFVANERALGGRLVAAKVCWRGGDEAMRLGRLEHPGIMPVHSIHHEDETGLSVIVMPLLSRTTLAGALDAAGFARRLPRRAAAFWRGVCDENFPRRDESTVRKSRRYRPRHAYETTIVRIGVDLAEALSYAHAQGVVHGDLKPSNVLLLPAGGAVLMDFNLAFEREQNLQRAGGTLPYMPPELLSRLQRPSEATGNGAMLRPDERSDIFSLGATLYECLTGRLPFGTAPDGNRTQIIAELLDRQRRGPRPLGEFNDRIDPRLDALIRSCLAYEADDRPASAAEVVANLRGLLSLRRRTVHTIRRWPRLAAAFCALLVLVAGLSIHTIATLPPADVRQLELGWAAERLGDYETAIVHYEVAIESNPDSLEARFSRGRALLALGEEKHTIAAFKEFSALYETCRDARVAAALGYAIGVAKGSPKEARECYRYALENGVNTPEIVNNLGCCEHQLTSYEESVRLLNDAVNRTPRSLAALHNLGLAEFLLVTNGKIAEGRRLPTLRSAIGHIDQAIAVAEESGGRPADLYFQAAAIHARTTQSVPASEEPDHFEAALFNSRRAVESGLPPTQLRSVRHYCPRLSEDDRFQELRDRPVPDVKPPQTPRLMNPLSRFQPPLHLQCSSGNPLDDT